MNGVLIALLGAARRCFAALKSGTLLAAAL
jgi:hypothetical protein